MSCKKNVAIIGGGPSGCMCAYFASQKNDVTIFDFSSPLHTLLYTGGGRCNLAYGEYGFKELTKFYPRGEKFLYSVFSKFSTTDTIAFFKKIGVETYTQQDLRIFPISNSAKDVRGKFLAKLKSCKFKKEEVINVTKQNENFLIKTNLNSSVFDVVIIAIGGHAGFSLAKNLGHNVIPPKPSLVGLIPKENFTSLQGVSFNNVTAVIFCCGKKLPPQNGDLIFTHEGISGPLTYKISSICAREDYNSENPIKINLNFLKTDINLQELFNSNGKKDIKNIISELVPKSFAEYILKTNAISPETKGYEINKNMRELISNALTNFEINLISPAKEGEIVTSGGVDLKEVSSSDMQSKLVENLYFCGEVLDVDGFCGGFNLQNCWSTGYVAGNAIMQ